ncbi:Molybdenum transport ATP-binding protein ModC [Fulvivirga imtechensis AK7]|uniref:Molybdenum transport ATP-binding protein ModC n=1 Tax=Fulvivirga imtechensis AK7 TaxID=1237149 RepID=L8K0H9_9BACT|nr:ABC transporter ATP-binding protein [Fulvivirga imtechensis]ELR73439.1 Molybdenum transport ATP-binding protein ModC [Fulvivirga imtechensis AK7]
MIHISLQKILNTAQNLMTLNIELALERGQFATLYGASGAGKTSTLRMLAGLMKPDEGQIIVNDKTWVDTDKGINLPPQQRRVGLVFQDYALFPNMTVRKNLEYALTRRQKPDIVDELMDMIELSELQDRKPGTLSGGQKQRVALARALVQRPDILLLDEPLSALDSKIRIKLQDYLQKVHRQYGLTTILVSHDIPEVFKLSDQVYVLEDGVVARQGSPAEVFGYGQMSGKFRFTGEVLEIRKEEVVYIVTVLIGTNVVKVIAQESEIAGLKVGDQVMVASKAFNPVIQRVGE